MRWARVVVVVMVAASPTAWAENAASLLTVMMLVTGVGTVADRVATQRGSGVRDAITIVAGTAIIAAGAVIVITDFTAKKRSTRPLPHLTFPG